MSHRASSLWFYSCDVSVSLLLFYCWDISIFCFCHKTGSYFQNIDKIFQGSMYDHIKIPSIIKKNTIILCSASWIHYWTDFDDFGLQMTVKEWFSAILRKNWSFQNASLQKCLLGFKGGADYLLGIHLQIMKRWADYLEQDGFVYIICLLAANDMFGLCVSKKGEGGGGAEGAV